MHCSAPIMAGLRQEIRWAGGGCSSSSLCISIHQLPAEKIVVLRASEAILHRACAEQRLEPQPQLQEELLWILCPGRQPYCNFYASTTSRKN